MDNGLQGFKIWLEQNREKFADYSVQDICNLAIACGFDRRVVTQWARSQIFKGGTL